jgi:hypothetical protein
MVMYVMNYIDRNALPQARVQGLEKDLNLAGYEYNIVLSLTFIGYILMQGTSTVLGESFGCSLWSDTVQCPVICCCL